MNSNRHARSLPFTLIAGVLLVVVAVLASCGRDRRAAGPPNIILILADDLGYNDIGCYYTPGSPDSAIAARIATPNIDRLAREGVRLTQFYATAAVCTPSRAGLLTGCYPPRVGLSVTDTKGGLVLDGTSKVGLHHDETTLAELLSARGYATACIGKWHLGHRKPFLPTHQGFDYFYGPMFRNRHRADADVMRGEEVVESVAHEDLTRRYTDEAIAFIRRNAQRPFFIYLPESMPHPPLAVRKEFRGKSERGLYGDAVMDLDMQVGRLMQELFRNEIAERTLVIFTSDNGPELAYGPLGSAYPLRGGKLDYYEGGFRVPCVMWWPGAVPRGSTINAMCAMMDLYPTLARLAGASLPDATIDGIDVGDLLLDRMAVPPRDDFFYFDKNEMRALRKGSWKLIFAPPSGSTRGSFNPRELYNLANDPGERHNVIADHPDVVAELTAHADRMRADLGDDLTGHTGANRRPSGHWRPADE